MSIYLRTVFVTIQVHNVTLLYCTKYKTGGEGIDSYILLLSNVPAISLWAYSAGRIEDFTRRIKFKFVTI